MDTISAPPAMPPSGLSDMTLCDWFAGQALAGLCASEMSTHMTWRQIAEWAYDVADAMMEEKGAALAAVAPLIAAQAAAAEREECARIADMYADENIRMAGDSIINDPLLRRARTGDKAPMQAADWALVEKCTDDGTVHSSMFHAAQNIARAIRARGDKPCA